MKPIRNSAKAIIIRDGHLLAVRNVTENDDWYLLPGGGQHHGETLRDALLRECREEIGATVQVDDLLFVREYIGATHEFADIDGDAHQVEFMFECHVDADYIPHNGTAADIYQTAVEWLPIVDLQHYRLFPQGLGKILLQTSSNPQTTYLGDVN